MAFLARAPFGSGEAIELVGEAPARSLGVVIGIDPGLDGAVALYTPDVGDGKSLLEIWDMPTLQVRGGRLIDIHLLCDRIGDIDGAEIDHVYIEDSWPRPTDGRRQAHKSGRGWGEIYGALAMAQIPCTSVAPAAWKKTLQVPADKDGARARASQLLPAWAHLWPLKKHHGRAEAALIALYGARLGTR